MGKPIKKDNSKYLIDISNSDEEAYNINDNDFIEYQETNLVKKKVFDEEHNDKNSELEESSNINNDSEDDENTMYLIHNENTDSDDPNISQFIQFCIKKGLFDNTFYDMHNTFSVVATKLPKTFEKLSKNGDDVKKRTFIHKFKKEFGYPGDINFIYNCLDESKKGFITWDDFVDFFLPYIQYITV